jgi:hypothetical protein
MLENVDHYTLKEKLSWGEPAKVRLGDAAKVDTLDTLETTSGTASSAPSSRSGSPSPRNSRASSKEIVNSGLTTTDTIADQSCRSPGQRMVTMWNISHTYNDQMVLEELRDGGFQMTRDIDLFYMPVDPAGLHLGCCLISFTDNSIRHEFLSAFQGRPLRLAGPTARLKVQITSTSELELLMSFGTSSAKLQQELACPLKATSTRKAQFCPFCGNHVGHSSNFCVQCGSSLKQLR